MPTVSQVLRVVRERLAARGLPAVDAEELVSRALGVERGALRLDPGRTLDAAAERTLAAWTGRRLAGEPVQYITGRAAFRGLDLAVDPRVLVPRPETEVLVGLVLAALAAERARWPAPRVLDLGVGSGAIALAIAAEWPTATVLATDASADALAVADANATALGLGGRVAFRHGDWFDAVAADERFEVVVSNPPYLATGEWDEMEHEVRAHEPHAALFAGTSGLDALREIVDLAPRHLVTGGLLALELSERRAEEVAAWLEGAHDWESVELHPDLGGWPRVLLAHRARGPAIAPLQWREER